MLPARWCSDLALHGVLIKWLLVQEVMHQIINSRRRFEGIQIMWRAVCYHRSHVACGVLHDTGLCLDRAIKPLLLKLVLSAARLNLLGRLPEHSICLIVGGAEPRVRVRRKMRHIPIDKHHLSLWLALGV